MTAPSNTNTSGLDCVRIIACHLPEAHCPDTVCLPITITAGDLRAAYSALVTAASAQARIDHLLARIETARIARVEHNRQFEVMKDRATAAEARADRLSASLIDALPYVESCEYDNGYKPGAVLRVVKNIRAALQQETQP